MTTVTPSLETAIPSLFHKPRDTDTGTRILPQDMFLCISIPKVQWDGLVVDQHQRPDTRRNRYPQTISRDILPRGVESTNSQRGWRVSLPHPPMSHPFIALALSLRPASNIPGWRNLTNRNIHTLQHMSGIVSPLGESRSTLESSGVKRWTLECCTRIMSVLQGVRLMRKGRGPSPAAPRTHFQAAELQLVRVVVRDRTYPANANFAGTGSCCPQSRIIG